MSELKVNQLLLIGFPFVFFKFIIGLTDASNNDCDGPGRLRARANSMSSSNDSDDHRGLRIGSALNREIVENTPVAMTMLNIQPQEEGEVLTEVRLAESQYGAGLVVHVIPFPPRTAKAKAKSTLANRARSRYIDETRE